MFDRVAAGLKKRWRALPGFTRGAILILCAAAISSMQMAQIKSMGTRLDTFQVGFFRFAAALIVILPFVARAGPSAFLTGHFRMHAARGTLSFCAQIFTFYAIIHLTLAQATALSFTKSLYMVPLAILVLGETVGWRRALATATGFLGVLVMIRPGYAEFSLAVLAGLIGPFFVADSVVVARKLAHREQPVTILFYFGVVTTTVSLGPALYVWQNPTWFDLFQAFTIGVSGLLLQRCLIGAYQVTEASAVAPFDYTRLLFAAAAGFMLFGEIPDPWTWVGAAIIAGSSIYIARRETKLARHRPPPPPEDAT